MKNILIGTLTVIIVISLGVLVWYSPWKQAVSTREKELTKKEYETQKLVEDTARATIVNYNSYLSEYETYIIYCEEPKDTSKCDRALASKTEANRTANKYNEYITKNNYLFEGNVPKDLPLTLELLK